MWGSHVIGHIEKKENQCHVLLARSNRDRFSCHKDELSTLQLITVCFISKGKRCVYVSLNLFYVLFLVAVWSQHVTWLFSCWEYVLNILYALKVFFYYYYCCKMWVTFLWQNIIKKQDWNMKRPRDKKEAWHLFYSDQFHESLLITSRPTLHDIWIISDW